MPGPEPRPRPSETAGVGGRRRIEGRLGGKPMVVGGTPAGQIGEKPMVLRVEETEEREQSRIGWIGGDYMVFVGGI